MKNLFKIKEIESTDDSITAKVILNKEHDIFKGHFPGNPILPGVTYIALLKLIGKEVFHQNFNINELSFLKFLTFVNPLNDNTLYGNLTYRKDENKIFINGKFTQNEKVCCKVKGYLN